MDLSTVTVADFKAYFFRDFPYLPVWDSSKLYNAGKRVYYTPTELFYDCLINGTTSADTPADPGDPPHWAIVADDIMNYIQDLDIEKAFAEAQVNLNQSLFSSDANIRMGYLYLTAHYLVNDIRAGLAGISAVGMFPLTSRSAGSVSESYSIPQAYLDNPVYTFYTTSSYGLKYLSLVLPQIVGNVGAVAGWTQP